MGARLANSGCEIGTKNGRGCEIGVWLRNLRGLTSFAQEMKKMGIFIFRDLQNGVNYNYI